MHITDNFYLVKKVKIFCILLIYNIFKLFATHSDSYQPERANFSHDLLSPAFWQAPCRHKRTGFFTYSVSTQTVSLSPEMLTSSRRGCRFLWASGWSLLLAPCGPALALVFANAVYAFSFYHRKFIYHNFILMLKPSIETDIKQRRIDCISE